MLISQQPLQEHHLYSSPTQVTHTQHRLLLHTPFLFYLCPIMTYPQFYNAFRRSAGTGSKESPLSLEQTQETLPKKEHLGANDVVIKIHSVSLNYRDIAMLVGGYPAPVMERGIPCSDCAAEVVATGSAVEKFQVGDRVAPHCNQGDIEPTDDAVSVAIGANAPGVLREYAVFQEKHLVHLPAHLPWDEVSYSSMREEHAPDLQDTRPLYSLVQASQHGPLSTD
jgi:hypothetical protein